MNKLAPIILCFWSISAQAQDLNYSLYEIKEGTTCSDAKDSLTSRLAAEAYFHRGQYADAYHIYVCMETAKINFNKEGFYQYALAAQSTGAEVKAQQLFLDFSSRYPQDDRAKNRQQPYGLTNDFETLSCQAWPNNSVYSDYGLRVVGEELVWCSNRPNASGSQIDLWEGKQFSNLYMCSKADVQQSLRSLAPINAQFHESTACLSADGQTLYYTQNKALQSMSKALVLGLEIRKAILVNGLWKDAGVLLIQNFEEVNFAHPTLSANGQRLYFAADAKGGFGQSDIWYIDLTQKVPYTATNAGAQINSAARESFPFVSQEGYLYFASDGHPGLGGLDVFCAKENAGQMKLGHLPAPINSISDDFAFVIDPATKQAYVSSNRAGGKGSDDIYQLQLQYAVKQDEVQENSAGVSNVETINATTNDASIAAKVDTIVHAVPHTEIETALDAKVAPESAYQLPVLYFELNRAELTAASVAALKELATYLNAHPNQRIELSAHADCRGTASYNLSLSQKRANACKSFLDNLLVNKSQVLAKGYGETQLVNACDCAPEQLAQCDEAAHALNRRIEFTWFLQK